MNERIRFTLKHPAGLPAPGHEHGLAGALVPPALRDARIAAWNGAGTLELNFPDPVRYGAADLRMLDHFGGGTTGPARSFCLNRRAGGGIREWRSPGGSPLIRDCRWGTNHGFGRSRSRPAGRASPSWTRRRSALSAAATVRCCCDSPAGCAHTRCGGPMRRRSGSSGTTSSVRTVRSASVRSCLPTGLRWRMSGVSSCAALSPARTGVNGRMSA